MAAKQLMLWYFEDQVKIAFGQFVACVERGTRDEMDYYKDQMLKIAFQLVSEVPERERETMGILINKAGDKNKRIASRVPYLLGMLVQKHSNMRAAVVAEVERFLYRPSLLPRAQYYLVLFLTQVTLTSGDSGLAKTLIQIYFSFFARLLQVKSTEEDRLIARKRKKLKKRKKEAAPHDGGKKKVQHKKLVPKSAMDSKMLTALLTGVSRAFPYLAVEDRAMFDGQMDTFYRVVYATSFNKAIFSTARLFDDALSLTLTRLNRRATRWRCCCGSWWLATTCRSASTRRCTHSWCIPTSAAPANRRCFSTLCIAPYASTRQSRGCVPSSSACCRWRFSRFCLLFLALTISLSLSLSLSGVTSREVRVRVRRAGGGVGSVPPTQRCTRRRGSGRTAAHCSGGGHQVRRR